jgi:hypothetical protein
MPKTQQIRKPWQEALAWIMAVSFVVVGATLFAGLPATAFYDWYRTRSQTQVEASLVSVESKHDGRKRWTEAVFSYPYEGRQFTSDKIAIFKTTGGFYDGLSNALRQNRKIPVFIDPRNPRLAVIDREFVLWPTAIAVPFSLTFAGVGVYLISVLLRDRKLNLRNRSNHALQRIAQKRDR